MYPRSQHWANVSGWYTSTKAMFAIQRDPDTLEKWPARNLTKFNKWNYRVLYLQRNNLKDQGMLESSLAGKDLKVLLDTKLNKKGQRYYSLH